MTPRTTLSVLAAAMALAWSPLVFADSAPGSGGHAHAAQHEGCENCPRKKEFGCKDCDKAAEKDCADCQEHCEKCKSGDCDKCGKGDCPKCSKKAGCENCPGKDCADCQEHCEKCKSGDCDKCEKGDCPKCKKTRTASTADSSVVRVVTVSDVDALLENGSVVFVDANGDRTRKREGIIPGATLLSSSSTFDPATELPSDKSIPLVFYCANTRCTAAPAAAERALAAGHTNVNVLSVGIVGWKEAGKKTASVPRS